MTIVHYLNLQCGDKVNCSSIPSKGIILELSVDVDVSVVVRNPGKVVVVGARDKWQQLSG